MKEIKTVKLADLWNEENQRYEVAGLIRTIRNCDAQRKSGLKYKKGN